MKNIIELVTADKNVTIIKKRIAGALSLGLLFSIILASCSKSSGGNSNPAPPVSPNTVNIVNMAFSQATITVTAGTKVTWTNNDNMTHTVTADDDSFDSGNIGAGSSYSRTFSTAGTYPYHCTIHPSMTGKVVVQ
jgi:plastocyanin